MFSSSFFNSIVQLPKFRFANILHFQNHGNPRIYIGKDIMMNNLFAPSSIIVVCIDVERILSMKTSNLQQSKLMTFMKTTTFFTIL